MKAMQLRRFWAWPWELRTRGIVGINSRNLWLLADSDRRSHWRLVDDKIETKRLCEQSGIAVPQTLAVIERFGDIRRFPDLIGDRSEFVVKPARGSGGRGVLVICRRTGTGYETSSGEPLELDEIRYRMSSTLSGLYSLGGLPDRIIVEQRVALHPCFESVSTGGTPDIRVVVRSFRPAMAMLRLPARASQGKANLHLGAMGVGIDCETGRTLGGVCGNKAAGEHPDTGRSIRGWQIPFWEQVLAMSERLSRVLGMEYCGIDIVLDAIRGPLVLEANARPGLAIQIANRNGLGSR